jgi:hypothetical protein
MEMGIDDVHGMLSCRELPLGPPIQQFYGWGCSRSTRRAQHAWHKLPFSVMFPGKA